MSRNPCAFAPAAELNTEAVAAIAEQVRVRVLRWFARSGLIEADDLREMLVWEDAPEPMPDWDLLGQPEPDFGFDQRIAW